MRSLHILSCVFVCLAASALGQDRTVEGTIVRKGKALGVRTEDDTVIRLVRPKKHSIGSDICHMLAAVPNGTYVRIKPRLRSMTQAVPIQLLNSRKAILDVTIARNERNAVVDGRNARLHWRRPLQDESSSGMETYNNSALIKALAGRTLRASFYAIYDKQNRISDLFLIEVRAKLVRDAVVVNEPNAEAGGHNHRLREGSTIWFAKVAENGWQRIRYAIGNKYYGGFVRVRDINPE